MIGNEGPVHITGIADACELLARVFSFPDRDLTRALLAGTCQSDAQACLIDMGSDITWLGGSAVLEKCCSEDEDELFERLRRDHTVLYLLPGRAAAIWPYEAPFRYKAAGREGLPALFRSPYQLDVENHMRKAGVFPKTGRTEPADSIWNEFAFLSYLYGRTAASVRAADYDGGREWLGKIVDFWQEHGSLWLIAFMEQTKKQAERLERGAEYAAFADLGLVVLWAIEADVAVMQSTGGLCN